MGKFGFYTELGLDHVLDSSAYDHILFLAALAVPFVFKQWKQVIVLASIFTITHCLSLALSAFDVMRPDPAWIEALIPATIVATALGNIALVITDDLGRAGIIHSIATGVFGLVHGFGFSNYFNMLMAGEEEKVLPLLGFATGIELSQVFVILLMLGLTTLLQRFTPLKQNTVILVLSGVVIVITLPLLVSAVWPLIKELFQ
ncbi:HupE/UreJ family protein [Aureicoccus marinus]|uniref:HupE / UreJ protein n=1 Tax=Aureicoccus marinus TaxID=754435 RepID=A0A2S7T898_9FLAO|nr:HupE/UreJ family protein [Aureicoccus marinus]PQJ16149.1 HupE / UreJ protein [Aureicoccus marinus]